MKPYCGRHFTLDELQTLRHLIEAHPSASRAQLSRQGCVLLDWFKPNGELKDMACRVAMLRLQADGLFTLPAAQRRAPRQPEYLATAATDPARAFHRLAGGRATKQPAAHAKRCPPSDSARDPLQGVGLKDAVAPSEATAQRLAGASRLPSGAPRNPRRAPPSRHLLPSSRLNQRRSSRRAWQEMPHHQAYPADQGYLVLSPGTETPLHPVPLAPLVKVRLQARVHQMLSRFQPFGLRKIFNTTVRFRLLFCRLSFGKGVPASPVLWA
jgi:hypothetical protein